MMRIKKSKRRNLVILSERKEVFTFRRIPVLIQQ